MLRILVRMAIATIAVFALQAAAQDTWPSRPVKLVVPFPASGPLDVMARLIGQKLGENLGRPMVIENIAGATGSIGANAVARAAPDGYTILLTVDLPLVMFPAVADKLPYDPRADFRPVASLATGENGLFVNAALGAATVAELVAIAKAQPGKLAFSSAGIGSPAHFAGELFKRAAGVEMTHVPYKGAGPMMTDFLAGTIDVVFDGMGTSSTQMKAGKLRGLAIATPRRVEQFPDLPTMDEVGVPGMVVSSWYALWAIKGTPKEAVDRMYQETVKAMNLPDMKTIWLSQVATTGGISPEEFQAFVRSEIVRWGKVVRDAGVKVDL